MLCMHPVQSSLVPLQHGSIASTAQTRLGACRDCRLQKCIQSIGDVAAYPAYPLNPPLTALATSEGANLLQSCASHLQDPVDVKSTVSE